GQRRSDRASFRSGATFPLGGDDTFAESVNDLGAVKHAGKLLRRAAVADVRVLEDLGERAPALVLADHVGRDPLLLAGAGEEEGEGIPQEGREPDHRFDPSASASNTCRLLARDHAAPEPARALSKASKPCCGQVRTLAWCSRPRR